MIWDRCYDFENIFAEKISKKFGVFDSKQSLIMQKIDHNIGFWEKRQIFRRKLSKIAKNCDHNIDPCLAELFDVPEKHPGRRFDLSTHVLTSGDDTPRSRHQSHTCTPEILREDHCRYLSVHMYLHNLKSSAQNFVDFSSTIRWLFIDFSTTFRRLLSKWFDWSTSVRTGRQSTKFGVGIFH
jgi:hypothetical protein